MLALDDLTDFVAVGIGGDIDLDYVEGIVGSDRGAKLTGPQGSGRGMLLAMQLSERVRVGSLEVLTLPRRPQKR
jgi:hypothetical protein